MKAKRARHKTGRGKIPISFSIPRSQIDWLDQHPELNQSHLVSTLLAAHIEAFEAVQPEKIKLILKLRTLKYEFENTGIELEKSRTEYVNVKGLYDDELRELKNLRHLASLPIEQLKISEHGYVADKNSNDPFLAARLPLEALNSPEQAHANLLEKLKDVEGSKFQNKLDALRHSIPLPESIYKAFKEKHENISKQIGEIERLIVKDG